MGWTEQQSKILSIIPHVTGLFSFVGSSSIIIMILHDRYKKLSKPYYRLLFAMCIFDTFSSIALGLSTWPIPVGSAGVYAPLGNVQTCSAQAFFIQANIASPIYNFMLSYYFLLRVKYGMTETRIGKRAEPIMQIITIVFGLGTSFLCLGLGLFNDSTLWCWINSSPKGCEQSWANGGETTCERGDNAEIYRWAIFFGPLWACIVGCMIVMIMIFVSVRKQENKLKKYQFTSTVAARRGSTESSNGGDYEDALRKKKREDDRRRHAQSRQVAWQGLRFVGVFYLTWAFATVNRLLQLSIGRSYFWLMCLHTIFVPMQGFFNFLVFIYPRFKKSVAGKRLARMSIRTSGVNKSNTKLPTRNSLTKSRWVSAHEDDDVKDEAPPPSSASLAAGIVRDEEAAGAEQNDHVGNGEEMKVEDDAEEEVISPTKSISLMKGSFDDANTQLE